MPTPSFSPSRHEQAISQIAAIINENPDTSTGVQLRRFLWSLYNMHHMVNLWDVASRLNGEPAQLVSSVFHAALVGELKEDDIKRGLLLAGEMQRWDREGKVSDSDFDPLKRELTRAIRSRAPSYVHTELVRFLKRLESFGAEELGD